MLLPLCVRLCVCVSLFLSLGHSHTHCLSERLWDDEAHRGGSRTPSVARSNAARSMAAVAAVTAADANPLYSRLRPAVTASASAASARTVLCRRVSDEGVYAHGQRPPTRGCGRPRKRRGRALWRAGRCARAGRCWPLCLSGRARGWHTQSPTWSPPYGQQPGPWPATPAPSSALHSDTHLTPRYKTQRERKKQAGQPSGALPLALVVERGAPDQRSQSGH
jgi:hypothetical protein